MFAYWVNDDTSLTWKVGPFFFFGVPGTATFTIIPGQVVGKPFLLINHEAASYGKLSQLWYTP